MDMDTPDDARPGAVPASPPPAAPPTAPIPAAPKPAVWPTVLGVVMIVFGAGGVLLGGWGAVVNLFLIDFFAGLGGQGNPAAATAMRDWSLPMGLLSLVNAAAAGLLLAAGIGMVRRRRWSIRAATLWAWIKIVLVVLGAVAAVFMQRVQFEAMTQNAANGPAAMPRGVMVGVLVVIGLFTVAWGWALPIFTLVWLRLAGSRREIATWPEPGSSDSPGSRGGDPFPPPEAAE